MTKLRGTLARFGGFSLVGVANTLLSMVLIFALNECFGIDYRASYAISYVLTVLLAYVANARLVFGVPLSATDAVGFFAAYLSGMVFGIGLLWTLRRLMPSVNATLLSYLVIPATLVWNFFFANKFLSRRNAGTVNGG